MDDAHFEIRHTRAAQFVTPRITESRVLFFFLSGRSFSRQIGRVFLDRVDRWKRSRSNWFKGLFFFISSNWRRAISLAISESRLVENYMEERGET